MSQAGIKLLASFPGLAREGEACVCVCVCVCGELCGLVVKAVDWQPKGARFSPHQPPLEKKDLLPWHPTQAQEK